MATDSIPVRKPRLDFNRPIERFYIDGNPVTTHFFNALNLLFPDGERFFVKSVHDHARELADPTLLREIRAFAGQEGQHANQHERFFAVLQAQGYDLQPLLGPFRKLARFSRYLPRALRLSITAGAEHYTASMASLVFEHDMVRDCDPTMRDLIMWHALEEIEHKHVAYDVFVTLYPHSYLLRVLGFVIATLVIALFAVPGTRMLLLQDGRAKRLSLADYGAARAALRQGKTARFTKAMRASLLRYFVPNFHPNQQDDGPLLAHFAPLISQAVAGE